jgi:hypothetical protein
MMVLGDACDRGGEGVVFLSIPSELRMMILGNDCDRGGEDIAG